MWGSISNRRYFDGTGIAKIWGRGSNAPLSVLFPSVLFYEYIQCLLSLYITQAWNSNYIRNVCAYLHKELRILGLSSNFWISLVHTTFSYTNLCKKKKILCDLSKSHRDFSNLFFSLTLVTFVTFNRKNLTRSFCTSGIE